MQVVYIKVGHSPVMKRALDRLSDMFLAVERVPELGDDPDVLARDNVEVDCAAETFAALLLVSIICSSTFESTNPIAQSHPQSQPQQPPRQHTHIQVQKVPTARQCIGYRGAVEEEHTHRTRCRSACSRACSRCKRLRQLGHHCASKYPCQSGASPHHL